MKKFFAAVGTLCVAVCLAVSAFAAEYGEPNITTQTTMKELRENPSIKGSGFYTYCNEWIEGDTSYDDTPISGYVSYAAAEDAAEGMNLVIENYNKGVQITWQVYTQDSSDPNSIAKTATTLVFNANGVLTSNPTENITTGAINGADPATFSLSFLNSMQQNTGANNIVATTQNGYKPGDLVSYQINDDGTVVGNYSNEQTQLLGQIVLANFANNEGLASEGDNVWSATQSSGVALLGTAGTGNFGTLTNGALEASNVDLSKELVNMIVAQRNYQSNAQTIKTQDQILNTLVNLR